LQKLFYGTLKDVTPLSAHNHTFHTLIALKSFDDNLKTHSIQTTTKVGAASSSCSNSHSQSKAWQVHKNQTS
jgi:hypothetical protein